MTTKTLPPDLHQQALRAILAIDAWNGAIYRARCKEITTGKAGYYEYAIRTDTKHIPMRLGASQGAQALDRLEQAVRRLGWAPQELYLALGTARPALLAPGPHVDDWFQGQR